MIASSAPAWAVWLALGLWGLAIILCAVAVALARRLWKERLEPMVAPLLAMFLPAETGNAANASSVVERVSDYTGG